MKLGVGDRIVYPAVGIGKIVGTVKRKIAGAELEFFKVDVDEKHAQVMIPTDGLDRLGIRPLVGGSTAQKLFKVFTELPDLAVFRTWSKSFRTYEDRLKTGDPFEAAEVLRDLLLQAKRKSLSFGEKKVLELARNLLVRELAFSTDTAEDTIMAKVRAKVEKAWADLPDNIDD